MFGSRREAGRWLARTLEVYRHQDVVVLGVARGGISLARQVSESLDAPLDAVVVQEVPAPGLLDLTLATLTEDGICVADSELIAQLRIPEPELDLRLHHQRVHLGERVRRIRGDGAPMELDGRTVILVHDGVETAEAAEATVAAARGRGAARVVLATPVSTREALEQIVPLVDDMVCLRASTPLGPVAFWYSERWDEGDDAVAHSLRASAERRRTPPDPAVRMAS